MFSSLSETAGFLLLLLLLSKRDVLCVVGNRSSSGTQDDSPRALGKARTSHKTSPTAVTPGTPIVKSRWQRQPTIERHSS